MKRAKAVKKSVDLSDSYFELIQRHPLRSIRNEADLDAAQAMIDSLLTETLDEGGEAYLDALSDLVILYEREHHPVPVLPPNELLAYLLKERQMTQADLVRATGIAKATVCDLIADRRAFTVQQMQAVSSQFGLPVAAFLPRMST